ncbi:MAG: hypothetical protein KGJ86_00655 [Chloroflexota bacterium]|nr:hypothetical protein [Chloroflexota bacterium]
MTEPLEVVADILRHCLGLAKDQVVLYNQKFLIPPDDRMYASVGIIGVKTFGAATRFVVDPVSGELRESQSVNRLELLSVSLYSRSPAARQRNWEVAAALVSAYSQQRQEAHQLRIARFPTAMSDVSQVEGAARLNRYVLTIPVQASYTKVQPTEYFDAFPPPVVYTNA